MNLDKMNNAIKYITECKWTRKTVDCFGDKLTVGIDLPTTFVIRDLSILLGKAQVYYDQKEFAQFDFMNQAFWNLFDDEGFEIDDFEDWYENFSKEPI